MFLILRPAIDRRATTQRLLKGAKSRLQPELERSPANSRPGGGGRTANAEVSQCYALQFSGSEQITFTNCTAAIPS